MVYKFLSCFVFGVFLISCFSSNALANDELELVFVNLLWRHGARSPVYSFPSDPNNAHKWPQGPGQLTQTGMKQQYALGSFLKQRYSRLLSHRYKRSEIYIRSTDVDRTLMSAECNLDGLYFPEGSQKWNGSKTDWQPIPVHTVPKMYDNLLVMPPVNNSRYQDIMNKIWDLPEMHTVEKKYKAFLEEMKNLTSWKGSLNLQNIYQVRDTLLCEKAEGLQLPKWVTTERMKSMYDLSALEMGKLFGEETAYREEIARLGAGSLVKQILHNMNGSIHNSHTYKAIAYSAHDITIAGTLVALDTYKGPPPFATSVMFELYKRTSSNAGEEDYVVKVFYRPSPSHPPEQLKILGCNLNCPFSELKKKAASILPPEDKTTVSREMILLIISSCLFGLTLLVWIFGIIYVCRKRSHSKGEFQYHPVPSGIDAI